jgi:hypothetical protein
MAGEHTRGGQWRGRSTQKQVSSSEVGNRATGFRFRSNLFVTAEHDDRDPRPARDLRNRGAELLPAHARHREVHQDEVRRHRLLVLEVLERVQPIEGGNAPVALIFERIDDRLANFATVLDDESGGGRRPCGIFLELRRLPQRARYARLIQALCI